MGGWDGTIYCISGNMDFNELIGYFERKAILGHSKVTLM